MHLSKGKVGAFLMRNTSITKVAVIRSSDTKEFEDLFNSKMEELALNRPDTKIVDTGKIISAIITYEETHHIVDSVADEFHFEGIRYLCKHCPFLDDPHDRRIKRCTCKYAELGMTHKDHEACEYFYRQLKAGNITPLENYER